MGKESRRRSNISRKRKRNRLVTAGPTTSVHDLSDDLLELVLLGLDSPVYLVRAAAACKRWRRVAADGAFLRRFRCLHPPRAIGIFYSINHDDPPCSYGRFHQWPYGDPVFVPSSASETPSGLQLSLDFVPPADDRGPRELVDARGSLLLLLRAKDRPDPSCMCCFHHADYMTPDLIVCEPATRQYKAIPPPIGNVCIIGAFLLDVDGAAGAGIGMTNFRVLLVLYEHDYTNGELNGHGHPSARVFTGGSNNGGWDYIDKDEAGVYLPDFDQVHLAGRTGGAIYLGCQDKQVVVFDERTLEFSTMALPEHMMSWQWQEFGRDNLRVVGGGHAGTIVRIVHLIYYGGDLEVFRQYHGNGDWVPEMTVQLQEASRGLLADHQVDEEAYLTTGTRIIDADERLVVLSPRNEKCLFAVDLETVELKRADGRTQHTWPAFPYTLPWPPVMRACLEDGTKRRKRRRNRRRKRDHQPEKS